jgi:hypothetical protein
MAKKYIILSIFILALSACKQEVLKNEKATHTESEKIITKKPEAKNETTRKTCNMTSKSMTDLLHVLKQDNYRIEIREKQDELLFESRKTGLESYKTISFPKSQFNSVYVKRNNRLEKMKDNWYPGFSVTEICFTDELIASEKYLEISEMINSLDIFNEKNYDYILLNGNRLIYVSCVAKIFEEYAFGYKGTIKEIIEKNKR